MVICFTLLLLLRLPRRFAPRNDIFVFLFACHYERSVVISLTVLRSTRLPYFDFAQHRLFVPRNNTSPTDTSTSLSDKAPQGCETTIKKGEMPSRDGEMTIMNDETSIKNGGKTIMKGEVSIKNSEVSIKNGEPPCENSICRCFGFCIDFL